MNKTTQCPAHDYLITPTLGETTDGSIDNEVQPVLTTVNGTAELRPSNLKDDVGITTYEKVQPSPKRATFSEIVQKHGEWKESKRSDGWFQVHKQKHRNRFISQKGSAVVEPGDIIKFKAADTKVPLLTSNVHRDVAEQEIINYIYEKTQERVSLVKIKMMRQRDYNAYKLFVAKYQVSTFLDEKLWPTGISFRRFVNFTAMRENSGFYK